MKMIEKLVHWPLNPFIALALSACFLIGSLALMIEGRAAILRDGKEIILKSDPVDPRDLMRGDYVRLGYDAISSIKPDMVVGQWPAKTTRIPVWLLLKTGKDGFAEPVSASFSKPDMIEKGDVLLKSRPVQIYGSRGANGDHIMPHLEFGIERYYVPEGEGLDIEKARNQGRTTVAVRVSAAGVAQIARLMIDGETLYKEPLY